MNNIIVHTCHILCIFLIINTIEKHARSAQNLISIFIAFTIDRCRKKRVMIKKTTVTLSISFQVYLLLCKINTNTTIILIKTNYQ